MLIVHKIIQSMRRISCWCFFYTRTTNSFHL